MDSFIENARNFCQWVESDLHDIKTARQLLLLLMEGVPNLINYKDERQDEPEYPRRALEGWEIDFKRFSNFPFQYYWIAFSPCDLNDDSLVAGDVHDDLADIYGELWHGLQALDRGDKIYAINHWRESYFIHWGYHASSAIYAIDDYYRKSR